MYKIRVPHTVPGKPDATLIVNDYYPLKNNFLLPIVISSA